MTPNHYPSVRHVVAKLFEENELAALVNTLQSPAVCFLKRLPKTDEQLEAELRSTYAASPAVIASLDNLSAVTTKSRIRIWRSEYNRNLWEASGQPGKVYSFRYGPNGVPINRHGNPLSADRIKASILSHPLDTRKALYNAHTTPISTSETDLYSAL